MLLLIAGLALLAAAPFATAHPHNHDHKSTRSVGGTWYHDRSHPAYELFSRTNLKRQNDNSTGAFPAVGSPTWTANYPQGSVDVSKLPAAWTNALNAAVAAGEIPNIPQASSVNGNSVYPQGVNRNDPSICAATDRVCRIPDNIWDAPDGFIGIGFDDGPTTFSPPLYNYLQQQKQPATHFMIGTNILANPSAFTQAYVTLGDDIAVHTWTHPYMTTLSNVQVLAELGMTMQIIHDSTGGKLPRFWRPPYGDIDTRVSAIASKVFGMKAIIWNQDTEDWDIPTGGQTLQGVAANMQKWLSGPKSPGLIILEHELYQVTVQAFMDNYPLVKQNGWNAVSAAQLSGNVWFQNGTANANETDAVFSVSSSTTSTSSSSSASSTGATTSVARTGSAAEASGKANGAVGGSQVGSKVGTALGLLGAVVAAAL